MDWEADNDGRALASIARLFVALALLAERACARSLPLRCLILRILRPAEACARNFMIAEAWAAGDATAHPAVPLPAGDSVARLVSLAAWFRALALTIWKLRRSARRRLASRPERRCTMLWRLALSVLAIAAPRPADTS